MAEDGRIVYKIVVDSKGAVVEAKRAGEEVGSKYGDGSKKGVNLFEEMMTGAARRVGEAFVNMAAQATGAVKGFLEDSLKVGMEFESAMSQVSATLGYSSDDIANNVNGAGDAFDALREKAKQMGSETNFTATEAAEGLNILAMSGYDAEESIGMIEDVLHLAAAGSMDLNAAAGYVSGTMKGFADETKDATYYADLMAKGATLANTNVQQLGEAMSSGAAGAAAYSQDADSMTVALLRLAEQGEVGAAAGTALSAAMKNLYTPTDQAAEALKSVGVSAYDSQGKARDFNDVVNDLDAALNAVSSDGTAKYTEAQKNAIKQTIFGIQGLDAYNKMIVTSKEKQEEWAEALKNSSGEAAQQYDTMTDNLQGDMDILNSSFDGLKLAVSEKLTPALRDAAQFGSEALGKITAGFEQGGIGGALEAVEGILDELKNAFMDGLPDMVDTGLELLEGFLEGIADDIPEVLSTATEIIETLIKGISEHLPEIIPAAIEIILALVDGLISNIDGLVDAAIEIIMALADGLLNALPALIEKAPVIVEKLVLALIQNLPKILAVAAQIILKLVEGIGQNLPKIMESGGKIIGELVAGIIALIGNVLTVGKQIINTVWDGIKSLNPLEWGKDLISNFVNGIMSGIGKVADAATSIAKKITSYIGHSHPTDGPMKDDYMWMPDMIDLFTTGIEEGKPKVKRTIEQVFDVKSDIIGGFDDMDLSTAMDSVVGDLYAAAGSGMYYLPDIPDISYTGMSNAEIERELSVKLNATGKTGDMVIIVPVNVNDREIARATAWAMGEQLAWEEL